MRELLRHLLLTIIWRRRLHQRHRPADEPAQLVVAHAGLPLEQLDPLLPCDAPYPVVVPLVGLAIERPAPEPAHAQLRRGPQEARQPVRPRHEARHPEERPCPGAGEGLADGVVPRIGRRALVQDELCSRIHLEEVVDEQGAREVGRRGAAVEELVEERLALDFIGFPRRLVDELDAGNGGDDVDHVHAGREAEVLLEGGAEGAGRAAGEAGGDDEHLGLMAATAIGSPFSRCHSCYCWLFEKCPGFHECLA